MMVLQHYYGCHTNYIHRESYKIYTYIYIYIYYKNAIASFGGNRQRESDVITIGGFSLVT